MNCKNLHKFFYDSILLCIFQFFKRKHSLQNIVKPSFRIHSSVLGIFFKQFGGVFQWLQDDLLFRQNSVRVNSISFRTSKTLAGGQIPLNISEDHTPSLFLYSWVQATIIPQWPLGIILYKFFSLFGFFILKIFIPG